MALPLCIPYPGAFHRITSRGNTRKSHRQVMADKAIES